MLLLVVLHPLRSWYDGETLVDAQGWRALPMLGHPRISQWRTASDSCEVRHLFSCPFRNAVVVVVVVVVADGADVAFCVLSAGSSLVVGERVRPGRLQGQPNFYGGPSCGRCSFLVVAARSFCVVCVSPRTDCQTGSDVMIDADLSSDDTGFCFKDYCGENPGGNAICYGASMDSRSFGPDLK